MQTPLDLPLRETVGGYRLLNRMGLGAHGIVYHAENMSTRQHVALKVLTVPKGEDAEETRERFIREAETLARLQHPNIIRYEGSGLLLWQNLHLPYLAMEYVEDVQTLDGAVPGRPGEWALDRIDELLAALAYMHSLPLVHRGLRPTSLGIGKDNVLRVLDLGLARVQNSRLTGHSITMGGMGYTAPEQLMDARKADWRADLFSVGMIVLEMLGGANPLRMLQPIEAAKAIMHGRIPPTPRTIPEPVDSWCRRMTAALVQNRPPDAQTARLELARARQAAGPLPVPIDVEGTPLWATISAALRRARRVAAEMERALLVIGPAGATRDCLLGMAIGFAQGVAMTVLHTESFPELSRALGCTEDADKVFHVLCGVADENPTLVVFDVFNHLDVNQRRLFDLAARGRAPLVLLACHGEAPQTLATLLQVTA